MQNKLFLNSNPNLYQFPCQLYMDAMNVEVNVDYELIIGERKKKTFGQIQSQWWKKMPKQPTVPY